MSVSLAATVSVPDPALETAIRSRINNPEGALTQADMARITELRIVGHELRDLSGLETAINLRILVVGANLIEDLRPLAGLTKLVEFHAWNNQIRDITPLSGLKALTALQLGANRIKDLSSLADLTNLTWLDLASNQISDLANLSALINLKWLDVRVNSITDLQPLSGLTKL